MISALIAGVMIVGVFCLGWHCGSDEALTVAAKVNQKAMGILGVDWSRYIEAIRKATLR